MSANKEKKDLPWYVLYTKPRNEKKVAQRLSEAGYTSIVLCKKCVASGAIAPRWWKSRCLNPTSSFKSKTIAETRCLLFLERYVTCFGCVVLPKYAKLKSIPFKSGWESTTTRTSTSLISSLEILCASPLANSLVKKPSCSTAPTKKPSYSSKNLVSNSPCRSPTTTF